MPHYHFHLWTSESEVLDRDGTTLPDDDAARVHAKQVACELIKSKEPQRRIWRLDVADEQGATRFQLAFSAVDESLDHLDPSTRELVERSAAARAALMQTILESRFLVIKARAMNRRALGRPYLAATDGRRVL